MPYTITEQCISCDRCRSHCPTQAIRQQGMQFQIDASRCNDCKDAYSVPQCWAVCPTNGGCVPLVTTTLPAAAADYWDNWFVLYERLVERLKATQQPTYWQHWFEAYSSQLAKHRQVPS